MTLGWPQFAGDSKLPGRQHSRQVHLPGTLSGGSVDGRRDHVPAGLAPGTQVVIDLFADGERALYSAVLVGFRCMCDPFLDAARSLQTHTPDRAWGRGVTGSTPDF